MGDIINDDVDGDTYISVELDINGSIVNVKRKRVMLKSLQNLIGTKRSRSRSNDKKSKKQDKKKKDKHRSDSPKPLKQLKWVQPGIIVRVVSKKVYNGTLYNTKIKITDVLNDK